MTQALKNADGKLTSAQLDYVLLDGSSSMMGQWHNTLSAIQTYVDTLKTENVNSHGILHIFSGMDLEYLPRECPLADWPSLRDSPVGSHWGGTPLYDAVNLMGRRLRDLDPARCSIIIATDGQENQSTFTSDVQARAILDWCRAKGWQITFIGVNFNNASQASKLGATEAQAIGVQKELLSDATAALAKKRARYGLYGEDMHFTDGEKQQFGGYLAGPSASE